MTELLIKLGFTESELRSYEKEITLFSSLLGLNEQRSARAASMIDTNYDLSFDGVRQMLKFLVQTVLDDLGTPGLRQMAVPMPVAAAMTVNELNPGTRISSSEYLIIYLSGILFDVFSRFCTAGEHSCGRCGLNISREKLYKNPLYPHPEGIVSCLGYCDEIFKTGETISEQYGIDHFHFKGIAGLSYAEQSLYLSEGLQHFLSQMTGKTEKETAACLEQSNNKLLELSLLLNKMNHLIAREEQAYITFNELSLFNLFHLICLPDHYEKGKSILKLFLAELQQRIRDNDPVITDPIRIGCLHLPFTNPFMDRCFRENGAAVIVAGLYESPSDKAVSANEYDRCLRVFYGNRTPGDIRQKAGFMDAMIGKYKLDSFLFGQFENDRALGGDQLMVMHQMKEKNKVHYISMNNWSVMGGRDMTRIESLVEIIRERKI